MPILHAIVLGIVQGLSEFLPISSSGHLELTRWAFGWDSLPDDLERPFDVAVHLGTLVGAVAYLRHDVVKYLRAGLAPLRGADLGVDGRIAWFLVVSAVPAAVAGVVARTTRAAIASKYFSILRLFCTVPSYPTVAAPPSRNNASKRNQKKGKISHF